MERSTRPDRGSATLKFLLAFAIVAVVFVIAFALFGERVYDQFEHLARKIAEAT